MSRLRRLAKGLVLVALATELFNSMGRQYTSVLASPVSERSYVVGQLDKKAKENRGYEEAQRRIQQALVTQPTVLHLSQLSLTKLPPEIGQLTNLRKLSLRYNQLSSLPPEIKWLENLQSLDLTGNKLSSLPPEIKRLKNLQSLSLSVNQLSSLSSEIRQLKNLQSLSLGHNKLSSLPPEIGQLTNLRKLDFLVNQLSSLPPEIEQLKNLQSLSLGHNKLSSLPPEIGQLNNLQELSLVNNHLSSLPPEIGQLTNLRNLDLTGNTLSSLPPEIGQLTNLQWLALTANQLNSLPPMGRLTKLRKLDFFGNKLDIEEVNRSLNNSEHQSAQVVYLAAPPTPTKKHFIALDYPKAACKNRSEGRAEYRIWVSTKGTPVVSGLVFSTGSEVLDQAVIAAAKRYKIKPEDSNKIVSLSFDIKYSPKTCGTSESAS